jgi:hypothetical protein
MTKNSDEMAFEEWLKSKHWLGDDRAKMDWCKEAWQAAISHFDSTTNRFTGCKCKLYESERSKMIEAKRDKALNDLAHERKRSEKLLKCLEALSHVEYVFMTKRKVPKIIGEHVKQALQEYQAREE